MEPYQASEVFMAIGMLAAAGVISIYALIQTGKVDAEERELARPLFISAAGLGLLGIGSGSTFTYRIMIDLFEITISRYLMISYVTILLGAGTLSVAALMILDWKELMIAPLALMFLGLLSSIGGTQLGLDPTVTDAVVGFFTLLLLLVPGLLYGFLTYRTRGARALSLTLAVLTYPLSYLFEITPLEGNVFLIILRLIGPALVTSSFLAEDIEISGELFGYGAAFAVAGFWFSFVIAQVVIELVRIIALSALALVATLGLVTVAFTYGRWRTKPNPATIYLGGFFLLASLSILIFSVQELGLFVSTEIVYASWLMWISAAALLNVGAIVALEWNRVILLPAMLALPVATYLLISYPADPMGTPWFNPLLIITTALQVILPMGMYFYLWHQMRVADIKNRSRPLFLGIGILFAVIALPLGNFVNPLVASLLLVAFVIWLLGITGRADQLLGTN
ncbi:MAG: hypothetical protein GF309_16025 [Candidatus Lokiarchaeota archaeon]|nr:hypothetical protein [Candidatus Lokiarchaeota archaeon]